MKLYLSYQTFETLFISVPLEPSKDDQFIAEMIVVDAVSHLTDTWQESSSEIMVFYAAHVSHETSYSH